MNKRISPSFSVYLDVIRFAAAILVVLYHSNFKELTTTQPILSSYGHSAVIVFFVLSGFVIAYVTDTKEKKLRDYALSRMARIYSVALPVVLLTPFMDIIGESMNPAFYIDKTTHDHWLIRTVSSLLFLNEIWFFSIMSFSNVPYWSLCYEVWYYVLFAISTFTSGRKRTYLLVATIIFLGPKILLLFPLWYLGVILYRNTSITIESPVIGWAVWLLSVFAIFQFHAFNLQYYFSDILKSHIGSELHHQLTFSKYFLSDYILAPLIAINFLSARAIVGSIAPLLTKSRPVISYASSFTFILYLAHQPLLQLFGASIDGDPDSSTFYLQVLSATFLCIWLLGFLTEGRKRMWKGAFSHMLSSAEKIHFRLKGLLNNGR